MLRISFSILMLTLLWSCTEESGTPKTSNNTGAKNPKSYTLEEFSSYFTPISEIPTLDLQGMDVALVLDKNSFDLQSNHDFLPGALVFDWVTPLLQNNTKQNQVDTTNWVSLFCNRTDSSSSFCLAQLKVNDIKVYLLKVNHQLNQQELIHLGNISTIQYKDKSEEPGEKHDFSITDCEEIVLEIHNDSLFTRCMRYSATVGKDWRIDQNLYVNDTVRLPIIESSYSLY